MTRKYLIELKFFQEFPELPKILFLKRSSSEFLEQNASRHFLLSRQRIAVPPKIHPWQNQTFSNAFHDAIDNAIKNPGALRRKRISQSPTSAFSTSIF